MLEPFITNKCRLQFIKERNVLLNHILKAFTLAEVLITLLVIGIVASLTIPVIINNINGVQHAAAAKQVYATISQAVNQIQTQNSGVVNVGIDDSNKLRNDFCSVLKCIKTDTTSNIWGTEDYKFYKGGNSGWPGVNNNIPALILANGVFIHLHDYSDCTSASTSYGVNACAILSVDTNGVKGPNMYGKDLLAFWISYKNNIYKVLPLGTQGDEFAGLPEGCTNPGTSQKTSSGCTALILKDPDHMP